MIEIVVKNKECRIKGDVESQVLFELDSLLSYVVPGAMFMKFKHKWDGRKRLLNKNLEFSSGLLPKVLDFFNNHNLEVTVVDKSIRSAPAPYSIEKKLIEIEKPARPYQIDVANCVFNNNCGIIRLPTGSGKSLLSGLMIANLGKEAVFYVVGKDLLYQMHKLFTQLFDCKIGIIGDGFCDIGDINIISLWTVGRALNIDKSQIVTDEEFDGEKEVSYDKYSEIIDLLKRTKVHIFDECHYVHCLTAIEISKTINPEYIYGLSASPYRGDGQDLLIESILGPKIIDVSASELISQGYLVEPRIKFNQLTNKRYPSGTRYQTIYSDYIVNNDERNNIIHENAKLLVSLGHKTLILYNTIKHGEIIYEKIKDDIRCALLSGSDSQKVRDIAKKQIEDGTVDCLVVSKIFDQSVDIPSLSGLILCGSGKSNIRSLQRIGRVIRKTPDTPRKNYAAVFDFKDECKYLRQHAIERKNLYRTESGFKVKWKD